MLFWGLLGVALGAYWMANADARTQHMVRQRSRELGRRLRRATVRSRRGRSAAEQMMAAGRDMFDQTLHWLGRR